jgi:hypothetical protein
MIMAWLIDPKQIKPHSTQIVFPKIKHPSNKDKSYAEGNGRMQHEVSCFVMTLKTIPILNPERRGTKPDRLHQLKKTESDLVILILRLRKLFFDAEEVELLEKARLKMSLVEAQ